jgi:hypothetical protein
MKTLTQNQHRVGLAALCAFVGALFLSSTAVAQTREAMQQKSTVAPAVEVACGFGFGSTCNTCNAGPKVVVGPRVYCSPYHHNHRLYYRHYYRPYYVY